MSFGNDDEMILAQLKSEDHSVLSARSKAAISNLGEESKGAEIFLFLSMNQRIVALEKRLEFFEEAIKS